ncbi:F0F1 ATP synthase subunit delta [Leucobacter soli]|uniref:ATP synthase subunit delta n=1 Tax=Leucobacter soli TaxID=2812850 RepID=A0A916K294_9MICO|nr:F0F1 ATP synthase subunit delta [Leucobacter soli]CAG7616246.1 ATP synthase subunit delta [Leucobacter soli]
MGSASREALAAAKAALSGRLGKSAGAELLSASAQIAGSPALLGALGDASSAAAAKRGLVERLFGGISAGARAVLVAAVEQNWSNADELVGGVEELGLRAEAIANDGLADELLAAAATIDSSHELELSLGSKLGDPASKVALVERIFTGKLSASAVGVIAHLVANPRGRRVGAALRESARVAADQGGSELATVSVAAPLSAAQQEKLAGLLEQSAGRPVRVTTVVDPALVGGVRIQIGDDVIDGSVRSRIEDLRLQLAG